jgi:predicted AlkP superfamily pyrophosphatase or phosphodiesterase
VWQRHTPQLQLTYIPHLDYDLQRFGPDSPQAINTVRDAAVALDPLVDAVLGSGGELILLSEYSMKPVTRFSQPNRLLADAGLLVTRQTPDGKLVDYGRSRAFAMVDHQIAHVYVADQADLPRVRDVLSSDDAISIRPRDSSIDHQRSGELILEAASNAWLDYRWWSNSSDAPVFAKEVDIHRKPGYDALELFFDPAIKGVSQDPAKIRGSHGAATAGEAVVAGSVVGSFGRRAIDAHELASAIEVRLKGG